MGVFKKLFGKGKKRCSECGRGFEMPDQLLRLYAININDFSLDGMGGYCAICQKYLCDRHLEFIKANLDPNDIEWRIGCKRCQFPILLEPPKIDPDIERINFIKIT